MRNALNTTSPPKTVNGKVLKLLLLLGFSTHHQHDRPPYQLPLSPLHIPVPLTYPAEKVSLLEPEPVRPTGPEAKVAQRVD